MNLADMNQLGIVQDKLTSILKEYEGKPIHISTKYELEARIRVLLWKELPENLAFAINMPEQLTKFTLINLDIYDKWTKI